MSMKTRVMTATVMASIAHLDRRRPDANQQPISFSLLASFASSFLPVGLFLSVLHLFLSTYPLFGCTRDQ